MHGPDLIHLQQLCRLEIPGASLASALFDETRNVIPCDAMTLLWRQSAPLEVKVFHESETDVACGCVDTQTLERIFLAGNLRLLTVFEAEHPALKELATVIPGMRHIAEKTLSTLAVYFMDSGKRSGVMLLHRSATNQFSTAERAALIRLAPSLSAALNTDTAPSQFMTAETDAGILLLDCGMNIQGGCCRGRKLMQLAQATDSEPTCASIGHDLRQRLRAHFGAENIAHTPNFVFNNSWGRFLFRLHRLSETEIRSDQLIAVAVHRQEPLILHAFRRCQKLALTEKQTEISLLLSKGLSYGTIAVKLCITTSTVTDHVRKIYDRIGVANRSELVTALLVA